MPLFFGGFDEGTVDLLGVGEEFVEVGAEEFGFGVEVGAGGALECGVEGFDPPDDGGVGVEGGGGDLEVAEFGGEGGLDVGGGFGERAREVDVRGFGEAGDRLAPVGEEVFVGDDAAREGAGEAFGVEHVAEPEELGIVGMSAAVEPFEGGGDFEGVAETDEEDGADVELGEDAGPERDEAGDARVLDGDERAGGEIAAEEGEEFLAGGRRRRGGSEPVVGELFGEIPRRRRGR